MGSGITSLVLHMITFDLVLLLLENTPSVPEMPGISSDLTCREAVYLYG